MSSILPCPWPLRLTRLIFLKKQCKLLNILRLDRYKYCASQTSSSSNLLLLVLSFAFGMTYIWKWRLICRKTTECYINLPLMLISCRFPAKLFPAHALMFLQYSADHSRPQSSSFLRMTDDEKKAKDLSWHEPGKLAPSVPPSEVQWLARVVRSAGISTSAVLLLFSVTVSLRNGCCT